MDVQSRIEKRRARYEAERVSRIKACWCKNMLTWVGGFLLMAVVIFYSGNVSFAISKEMDSAIGVLIIPIFAIWGWIVGVMKINGSRLTELEKDEEIIKNKLENEIAEVEGGRTSVQEKIAKRRAQYDEEYTERRKVYRRQRLITWLIGFPLVVIVVSIFDFPFFKSMVSDTFRSIYRYIAALIGLSIVGYLDSKRKKKYIAHEEYMKHIMEFVVNSMKKEAESGESV